MTFEFPRMTLALILPLAICACDTEKKATPKSGTVSSEVLPGSASDAMLPYDSVRSQPPLVDPSDDEVSSEKSPDPKQSSKPKASKPKPVLSEPAVSAAPEPKPDAE